MRVRFGPRTKAEQKEFEVFARGVEALLAEAAKRARSVAWWQKQVAALSSGLSVEVDEGLVLRARERAFWPLADYIAERSPAPLAIRAGRSRWPLERALAALGGQRERFARATLRAGFSRGHLLEVVVNLPGAVGNDDELGAAENLVWDLLGERLANDWVGAVKVAPAPRGGALQVLETKRESNFPLRELPAAVDAAIAGVYGGLPEVPLFAQKDSDEWTMFELEPDVAADFADEDDLVMATTCVPELLKSRLSKQPFSSLRFSRVGELFFHLKYESDGSPEQRLRARRVLEDELDQALIEAQLGRVVGAGLGVRYAYVLLALVHAERAVALAAEVARRLVPSNRAWLIPLDSDLGREWGGVWFDSPVPYGLVPEGRDSFE